MRKPTRSEPLRVQRLFRVHHRHAATARAVPSRLGVPVGSRMAVRAMTSAMRRLPSRQRRRVRRRRQSLFRARTHNRRLRGTPRRMQSLRGVPLWPAGVPRIIASPGSSSEERLASAEQRLYQQFAERSVGFDDGLHSLRGTRMIEPASVPNEVAHSRWLVRRSSSAHKSRGRWTRMGRRRPS
jgi:hypothetical protein